jgi:hypothetical protein
MLISDTLPSRAEPPPSGWTDITLEQTYEYRNHCHGTRFTLVVMQGIRYKYKLIIAHMSDTAVYKVCKYINLEDNSIKDIQKLQSRGRDKPIPNTSRQPSEPEESYFSLNSTNLWTKQERNLRESNLRCVLILHPSSHIYRSDTGVSRSENEGSHMELPLGANHGAACGRGKSVVPKLVWPNQRFGRPSQAPLLFSFGSVLCSLALS